MVVKKNTKFWIGNEVEGRFKGIKTLFVVGNQKKEDIEKKLIINSIHHIYFGAGNQSKVNDTHNINYFLNNGFLVTYEILHNNLRYVPLLLFKHKNFHLVITFKSLYLDRIRITDSFKIEDDKNVYVMSKCNFYKTNKLKDYKGDKFI